jgi:hypothetical protein
MKFKDLVAVVDEFEKENELVECLYFGAIQRLANVRNDLGTLDEVQHIRRVIKPFLIQWGMMGRVVGRENLDWALLTKTLKSFEENFRELREARLLKASFNDPQIAGTVMSVYDRLDKIPYIGSPTNIPKILHLFNQEIFVMWDYDIREWYRSTKNRHIDDTGQGYIYFLDACKSELAEALDDRKRETGQEVDELERELRSRYRNKSLARIVDEYNWEAAPRPAKNAHS